MTDHEKPRAILSVDIGRERKRQYVRRAQSEHLSLSEWVTAVLDAEISGRAAEEEQTGPP
jgi:hypothetical protein